MQMLKVKQAVIHSLLSVWRSKKQNREAGYTIVEVLVSATVFMVVFMMIALLFARSTGEYSGWQTITATQLAQIAMEEALSDQSGESITWSTRANGVIWDLSKDIEETVDGLWTIDISVARKNSGKTYATLWTQVYRPGTR